MKRLMTIALLLAFLAFPALADMTLYTTDDVNLREGPGQNYAKIGALAKGTGVEFLGRVSTDNHGVDWYSIFPHKKNGKTIENEGIAQKNSMNPKNLV